MSLGLDYRKLWAGNAASNLGDGISFVAIPLLAAALTSDPVLIAGLSMVNAGARLLVVLPIGVLVDRVNRTTVLWAANLGRALVLATLALVVAKGAGSIAVLYGVFALIGVMESAADNSSLSILPAVVETEDLDKANSQISAAQLVADEFAGPPLGGLMFATAIALPFAAMGALYAAAAVLFLGLRVNVRPERLPGQTGSIGRDLLVGARWLKGNRLLFGLAVIGGLASAAYMIPFSILVLFSKEVLGLDAAGYGVLLSASAVGGLVGSIIAAPLRRRAGYARTVVGSLALGAMTLAAVSFTTVPWVAAICLAAYILHAVVWGICVNSLRQRLVPDHLRGRVNAVSKLLGLVGLTVGAGLGGVVAAAFGLGASFLAGGSIFAVCALVAWPLIRQWEKGRPPEETFPGWTNRG
ncbi:MAG TPA: MFS transporter [Candidatus Limnocylindrales bacterium]